MQQHTLKITAKQQPVVMERLLQVIRYRGFNLLSVSMFTTEQTNQLAIVVSVESDKSIKNLKNQLLKIIDIDQIKVEDQALQKITA